MAVKIRYGSVLVAAAKDIVEVLNKHGILMYEVDKVFEHVKQGFEWCPVPTLETVLESISLETEGPNK